MLEPRREFLQTSSDDTELIRAERTAVFAEVQKLDLQRGWEGALRLLDVAGSWREGGEVAYTGVFEWTAWPRLDVSKKGRFYAGNLLIADHAEGDGAGGKYCLSGQFW